MALTYTGVKVDPNVSSAVSGVPGNLRYSYTSVTLDSTYATGGKVLDPTQLGGLSNVLFGVTQVRTSAGNVSDGTLDCTSTTAPKLKLFASATTTAELGAGVGSGAVIDVLAFGY